MGVDGAHLVLEADGDTLDHVGNACLSGTQASGVLAGGVPHDELDLLAGGALDDTGIKVHVLERLWRGKAKRMSASERRAM